MEHLPGKGGQEEGAVAPLGLAGIQEQVQEDVHGQDQEDLPPVAALEADGRSGQEAEQQAGLDDYVQPQVHRIHQGQVFDQALQDPGQVGQDAAQAHPFDVHGPEKCLAGRGMDAQVGKGVGHGAGKLSICCMGRPGELIRPGCRQPGSQEMIADNRAVDKPGRVPVLEVSSECFLHQAPENLRAAISRQLTVNNPKYMDARRYSRWIGKQLKPKLYFFRDQGSTLVFPRGFANQAVLLCRQLVGVDPQIRDLRRRLDEEDFLFHGTLRPYQEQAVEDVLRRSFGVLEAGTGSGKTVMALQVIARRRQPTIIIVHSRELLLQWMERIKTFLGIQAGQAGGGRVDIRPVTVAIVNTVRKRIDELAPCFGQLIVDECHRVPASLFTDVVTGFDAFYMLGLSATAFRREDGMTSLIYTYMGDRAHRVDSRVLADSGAVVRPDFIQRPTDFSYGYRGEYSRLIKALAADEARNNQIAGDVAELVNRGHSGTVLVVSDRVAHCEVLARKLENAAIQVEVLTGRTPAERRAAIVAEVREGRVQVLLSTLQLIGEGFDCPGLATLVLATPIKFEGRLVQVVGRVMRPHKGKKARVIDYVDVKIPVLRRSAAARTEMFNRW